ncbi:MAG TPA: hypothetical protein VE686_02525 [Beijerinckiaceae bacterium]|nr:hypothetical protein [Beijerinckiaceae bacterium]
MKLSKVMALGAAGVLLFGTSLFSRHRDNPSWAWASSGAAAANLSEAAQAPAPQGLVWNDPPPAVQDVRAPAAPPPAPQASAPVPEAPKAAAVPARRGSAVARSKDVPRACAGKPCRPSPNRSRTMAAEAEPAPVLVEPIQFQLADGRL